MFSLDLSSQVFISHISCTLCGVQILKPKIKKHCLYPWEAVKKMILDELLFLLLTSSQLPVTLQVGRRWHLGSDGWWGTFPYCLGWAWRHHVMGCCREAADAKLQGTSWLHLCAECGNCLPGRKWMAMFASHLSLSFAFRRRPWQLEPFGNFLYEEGWPRMGVLIVLSPALHTAALRLPRFSPPLQVQNISVMFPSSIIFFPTCRDGSSCSSKH